MIVRDGRNQEHNLGPAAPAPIRSEISYAVPERHTKSGTYEESGQLYSMSGRGAFGHAGRPGVEVRHGD